MVTRPPRAPGASRRKWCLPSLAALGGLLALPIAAGAERLPVNSYTTSDGLAHDRVLRIVRDSRGFLWFCTAGGLSRFDGRRFVSYSSDDGLPVHTLTDLLENPDGSYWIASNGAGLVRYDPRARSKADGRGRTSRGRFTVFPISRELAANRVNVMYRDHAGRLWIGTDGGLFRMEGEEAHPTIRRLPLDLASHADDTLQVWSLLEDADGNLWIGTSAGLVRLREGRSVAYRIRPARGSDHVWALMMAPDRRLWLGHDTGLIVASVEELERRRLAGDVSWSQRLAGMRVRSLLPSSDGRVWAATDSSLYEFVPDATPRRYGDEQGLEGVAAAVLAEDANGNIWLGTSASGAARIARDGLNTYTTIDGLDHDAVGMLFETRRGQLCAVSRGSRINVFDGRRFHPVTPRLPRAADDVRSDSYYALVLHDRTGQWWIPSGDRLYRFPAVRDPAWLATVDPEAVYRLGGGPTTRGIWRLFEDARGDVWIARRVPSPEVLVRLERATGRLHRYFARDGLPLSAANVFAEDPAGNLWIGFWDSDLVRYRNGRFERFSTSEGSPSGGISALHVDRANRLWCGTAHGAFRIDDPGADRPRMVRYSTANGLADDRVVTITEDRSGRMYIGTRRGIDRLEPETGRIRHFTTGHGLAALETRAAYRDRFGTLWFASGRGLSRLVPAPDRPGDAPATLLQRVQIDGTPQPLPDLGLGSAGPLSAPSPGSRIEIEFFALFFEPGEELTYQYRLDEAGQWSPPSEQPSVAFPRLSPGRYRLLVRAVRGGGVTGTPAELSFTIPPPVWSRWWFIGALSMAGALTLHAAYRFRLARLLEIERIRTRLAMDLHDDVGSTLSQVAVLSEVARKRAADDRRVSDLLERIAEISRQLVDAMSDVIWAINPDRDSLRDLLQRMRRFATETLDAQDIQLRVEGPAGNVDVQLDAHLRRDVFLIFKESINNVLRHAKCTRADVRLDIERASLVLTVSDDGIGVGQLEGSQGLGMRSMRERAERLRADLSFFVTPGKGTTVRVSVPLGGRRPGRGTRKRESVGSNIEVPVHLKTTASIDDIQPELKSGGWIFR